MSSTLSGHPSRSAQGLRWAARVLGLAMALFFVTMFVGESLESRQPMSILESARAIGPVGVAGLAMFGVYAVAMLIAWRWERIGVLLAAGALGVFFVMLFFGLFQGNAEGGLSVRGVLNPWLLMFWLPIALFAWARRHGS